MPDTSLRSTWRARCSGTLPNVRRDERLAGPRPTGDGPSRSPAMRGPSRDAVRAPDGPPRATGRSVWQEPQGIEDRRWVVEPALDRAAVSRERRPKHRPMLSDAAMIGAPVREHDPLRHDRRVPAAVARDQTCQSATPVGDREQPARIDQLRLDLDEQERATSRMPCHEIDDAAFAIAVERCLRSHLPAGRDEHGRKPLCHRRVTAGDHALDPTATPACLDWQTDLEHSSNLPQGAQRDPIELAPLDRRVQRSRDARLLGNIELPPAEP